MNRRDFLKSSLVAGLLFGTGLPLKLPAPGASTTASSRTVLQIALDGGPDFRHMFVPPYSDNPAGYGHAYWSHRWKSHRLSLTQSAWQERWESDYTPVSSGGVTFGILNKAGWLREQFEAGHVAIVNNVYASKNRDHSHSLLKLESGDLTAGPNDFSRDGWGGRLASRIGGNVLSMTRQVRLFCNGPHPTNPYAHDNRLVISASDTRNMGLTVPDALISDPASTNPRAIMSRALTGYYRAKRDTVAESSPFHKFFQHEQTYREFGEAIRARLDRFTIPEEIVALYEGGNRLNNNYFGTQLRNALDCYAASDILGFRVGSLEYGGWDSHKRQAQDIEPQMEDLFGTGRGLDAFSAALKNSFPNDYANLVFVIAGEFGRQLTANGDGGTDHGRGNCIIVIGPGVKGGLYGDMFPESEIERYNESSADINGLTSVEHLYAQIADWMQAGTAASIFPNIGEAEIEEGLDLSGLMTG